VNSGAGKLVAFRVCKRNVRLSKRLAAKSAKPNRVLLNWPKQIELKKACR
jgi:hypothetical protein